MSLATSPDFSESLLSMNAKIIVPRALMLVLSVAAVWPLAAQAQNVAIVNGKPVPSARATALKQQIERSGRPVTDEMLAEKHFVVVPTDEMAAQGLKPALLRWNDGRWVRLGVSDQAFAAGFLFFLVTVSLSIPGGAILVWEGVRGGRRPELPHA